MSSAKRVRQPEQVPAVGCKCRVLRLCAGKHQGKSAINVEPGGVVWLHVEIRDPFTIRTEHELRARTMTRPERRLLKRKDIPGQVFPIDVQRPPWRPAERKRETGS